VPSLRRGEDERGTMLSALAGLYTLGAEIHWDRLNPSKGNCVRLPRYPWQRERFWRPAVANRCEVVVHTNGYHANGNGQAAKNGHAEAVAGLMYERDWMPRSLPAQPFPRPAANVFDPRRSPRSCVPRRCGSGTDAGLDRLAGLERW